MKLIYRVAAVAVVASLTVYLAMNAKPDTEKFSALEPLDTKTATPEIDGPETGELVSPIIASKLSEEQYQKDLDALRTEVMKLKADLRTLEQRFALSTVQSTTEYENQIVGVNFMETRPDSETIAELREEEESILATQEFEYIQRTEDLHNMFTAESVNESWSYETVNAINRVLQDEELVDTSVLSVVCKSATCRVEVEHSDPGKADEFALQFTHFVSEALPEILVDKQEHDDGFYTTTVFLAREENYLQDPQISY